jgi:hypothetical protein
MNYDEDHVDRSRLILKILYVSVLLTDRDLNLNEHYKFRSSPRLRSSSCSSSPASLGDPEEMPEKFYNVYKVIPPHSRLRFHVRGMCVWTWAEKKPSYVGLLEILKFSLGPGMLRTHINCNERNN